MRVLLVSLILAACGGDDSSSSAPDAPIAIDADTRPDRSGGQQPIACMHGAANDLCQTGCPDVENLGGGPDLPAHCVYVGNPPVNIDSNQKCFFTKEWQGWPGCCVGSSRLGGGTLYQWTYCQ
jgi:hypothetical protein